MTIRDIIFDNFVTLSLIAGLGILIFSNRTFDKRSNHYFMCFIGIVLLLDIADMADYYMLNLSWLCNFRYVTSALGYTLRPATLAILINILLRRKKFRIGLWVPVFLMAAVAFTSYFTHIMFWFTSGNEFVRGPLGFFSHILSAIYAVILIVLTIKSHHLLDWEEIIVVAYIVILCILAAMSESMLTIKFLLPGAMTVSCAMYYLFLYVETYKRDALTGVLNRRSLDADVEKMNHQKFVVISMDLNGLKDINDTKGHQTGDIALCTFADTCLVAAKNKYRIYRTGGDEFIAIGRERTAEDAVEFIELMRKMLKKTKYMASFGYALYTDDCSYEEIWNQADSKMYEDKMHYKHRASLKEMK